MVIDFLINWGTGFVKVQPPENWKDTKLELDWASLEPSASVQSINYKWFGNVAIQINEYREGGVTGATNGILEGLPLQMFVGSEMIFDGILDLANEATLWECDKVQCPIKETQKIDWLKDTAKSVWFQYLKDIGLITTADYKKTPYTVTSIPDGPQLTVMFVSELLMINQLVKEVTEITNLGSQAGGSAADTVAPYPGSSAGSLAANIIMAVAEVLYIGSLFFAIVKTAKEIFDQIVQPPKYKYCMKAADLFDKACQHLGVTFQSSILQQGNYKDTTIMPRKIVMPKSGQSILSLFDRPANEAGNPKSYGYYDGNFGQLIEELETTFNAAVMMQNGVLRFEEIHSYLVPGSFKMPNTGEPGFTRNYPAPFGTNAKELASSYQLKFQIDENELNTIHQYRGTTCEVVIQPNSIANKGNLTLPGAKIVDIPFALAKRKEYLTFVEQALEKLLNLIAGAANVLIGAINTVLNIINTIIGWFGGSGTTIPTLGTLPTNVMQGRIGWLELSNDSFDIQKIFIGQQSGSNWLVHPNNETIMSASDLMSNFHGKNLLSRGNQWLTYRNKKIPLCIGDFLVIKDRNVFTTADGKTGKFEKVLWQIYDETATVDYRINENWTNNYKEKVYQNGEG